MNNLRASKEQHKTHKLLSILLGLVLCLSMLPATVFAEAGKQTQDEEQFTETSILAEQNIDQADDSEDSSSDSGITSIKDLITSLPEELTENNTDGEGTSITPAATDVAEVTTGGTSVPYQDIEAAFTAANTAGTATITLLDNCTAPNSTLTVSTGSSITLDLASYTLIGNGQTTVLTVEKDATLTLDDSTEPGEGKITNGKGSYDDGYGGGIYVIGALNIKGGNITGNTATMRGGGIYSLRTSTVTMEGGSITDNTSSGSGSSGGGIYANGPLIINDGTISNNKATYGAGIRVSGTTTLAGGFITNNVASSVCGGVYVRESTGILTMTGGEISGNTASDAAGVYVYQDATFTMKGGSITGNTSTNRGGGVFANSSGTFNMEDGTITGNKAAYGGGVFLSTSGNMTVSGTPVVSDNKSSASGSDITNNVGTVGARITLGGELAEGANIGVSVYQSSSGVFNWIEPTLTSAVRFTTAEANTSYYADSSQYFFSDREGYGARPDADNKCLELAPAFTVTFNTQGGDLPLGASDTKTVVYGATYGELPTPTKSGFHFAAWSLSESDTGEHLHVGEDSEVTEKTDHTLYAHWQEKEVPEIDFSIPQTYDYDGQEHPFEFTVVNGPAKNDGLWKVYYFEHTGSFHEKPTDLSQFSEEPPVDTDDYCIVIVHPETTNYAYFESELIHNGVIIKPIDCTLSFETNGGSKIDAITEDSGSVIDLSAYTPTRTGYTFTGWYSDEELTDKVDSVTLTGDTTVYAGWEENASGAGRSAGTDSGDETDDANASDEGSTLPLTGSSFTIGLLILAACALVTALVFSLVSRKKRGKHSF